MVNGCPPYHPELPSPAAAVVLDASSKWLPNTATSHHASKLNLALRHTFHGYSHMMSNTLQRKACRSESMHCGHTSHAACTQVTLRRMGRDPVNDEVYRLY
jgi:hypothetical protein